MKTENLKFIENYDMATVFNRHLSFANRSETTARKISNSGLIILGWRLWGSP